MELFPFAKLLSPIAIVFSPTTYLIYQIPNYLCARTDFIRRPYVNELLTVVAFTLPLPKSRLSA